MSKRALITGVTGQDGAYLSKLLLERGYQVFGGTRRASTKSTWRLEELGILDDVELVELELLEESNIRSALERVEPDEVYNLAAQSSVKTSFETPVYTVDVNALGALRLLEALRSLDLDARFYQASSSEMFGKAQEPTQSESTPFHPRSPYAVSKLTAHWATVNYREAYGLHASSGILFNHESPLRGYQFVTRKISLAFARIVEGEQEVVELGNLDAKRDWGHALDYVEAIRRIVHQDHAGTYVVATGETRSIREFVEEVAAYHGIELRWKGQGVDEEGIDASTGKPLVRVNPRFFRPAEVDMLRGDASRARRELKWSPRCSFRELAREMAQVDHERVCQRVAVS